jgi:hypothetical protein
MKFTHWFDRRGLALAFAALTLVGHGVPAAFGQEKGDKAARESDSSPEVKDEFAGVKFLKPDSKWTVENTGPQGIQNIVCVANPSDRWAPRFVVQVTSALAMPQGMENRLRLVKIGYRDPQQKAPIQELDTESIQASRVRITKKLEKTTLGGREATVLGYDLDEERPYRTVEYGVFFQDNFYLIQAAAPVSEWENPAVAAMFEKAFKSFTFLKSVSPKGS